MLAAKNEDANVKTIVYMQTRVCFMVVVCLDIVPLLYRYHPNNTSPLIFHQQVHIIFNTRFHHIFHTISSPLL
jgi:hypothetical protein